MPRFHLEKCCLTNSVSFYIRLQPEVIGHDRLKCAVAFLNRKFAIDVRHVVFVYAKPDRNPVVLRRFLYYTISLLCLNICIYIKRKFTHV